MIHNIGLSLRDQAQCLHKDEALSAQDTRPAWCQQPGNIIAECWLSLDLLSSVMSKIWNESDSSKIVYLVYLFHF